MYGQDWNGLKARTYGEPGRNGQQAKNKSLGANGTLIPVTSDRDNGIFPVTAQTLFNGVRLHATDPTITCDRRCVPLTIATVCGTGPGREDSA